LRLGACLGFLGFDTCQLGPYYTRPMSPARSQSEVETVDAMVLAARSAEVRRTFRLAELPRLNDMAGGADDEATLAARFHLLDSHAAIAGRVAAVLRLTCQRCLQPVDVAIDDEFHIALVASEAELAALPDVQDAAIVDASKLDLAWFAEEQMLLALPLVPLHSRLEVCGRQATRNEATESIADVDVRGAEVAKKQLPFANLRDLLKKQ